MRAEALLPAFHGDAPGPPRQNRSDERAECREIDEYLRRRGTSRQAGSSDAMRAVGSVRT